MKGLLIKDLKLMKTQKHFFFTMLVIALFMPMLSGSSAFAMGYLGFGSVIFTLNTISYDEADNGYAFLFCLPITRKNYVLEKYSYGLLIGSVSCLFGIVTDLLLSLGKHAFDPAEFLVTAFSILLTIVLMLAVMLPIQIKFGGEKSRLVFVGVAGFFILLSSLADFIAIDLIAQFDALAALPVGLTVSGALLGCIVLLLLSVKLSVSIMSRKEF